MSDKLASSLVGNQSTMSIVDGFIHNVEAEVDEKLRNITGILQDKFPNVKISDIPGLDSIDGLPSTGTNFLLFMCSLVLAMFWITYITFFNSRIMGRIATRISNKFISDGYLKVRWKVWMDE